MDPKLFESSRGEILRLLRRAPQSVNDLAAALGVTDNAVRANLARLERDGLIERAGRRPGFRKPESVYDITPKAERLFAKAYAPVLKTLLAVLESHLCGEKLDIKLQEVGRQLAAPYLQSMEGLSFAQRARKTLQIIEDFGGLADIQRRDSQAFVIGFGCPFSELVSSHPKLCLVVQSLVGELLGQPVKERCQRGERPKCCFLVENQ
jgi:predicted ArsR family transcriptional regulator